MIACKRIIQLLLVPFILVMVSGTSRADAVGTFKRVEGAVDVLRPSQTAAAPARVGDPVSMGDAVRTKRNARAEIRFMDDTVIQLAPETRIVIDEYSFRSDGGRERGLLSLLRGKVRSIVSKLKAVVASSGSFESAGFSIKTPTAIAGVKGTDFIVYYERGVTGILFLDGSGFTYNPQLPDRIALLHGGQAAFIRDGVSAPTNPQSVSDSFIAPHVQDTGTESSGGPQDDGTNGNGEVYVDVAGSNTTSAALTDVVLDNGGIAANGQGSTTGGPVQGDAIRGGGTSLLPESIPISETNPELITTKVKVKVTM